MHHLVIDQIQSRLPRILQFHLLVMLVGECRKMFRQDADGRQVKLGVDHQLLPQLELDLLVVPGVLVAEADLTVCHEGLVEPGPIVDLHRHLPGTVLDLPAGLHLPGLFLLAVLVVELGPLHQLLAPGGKCDRQSQVPLVSDLECPEEQIPVQALMTIQAFSLLISILAEISVLVEPSLVDQFQDLVLSVLGVSHPGFVKNSLVMRYLKKQSKGICLDLNRHQQVLVLQEV